MEITLFNRVLVFNPFDGVRRRLIGRQRAGHGSSLFSVE